MAKAEYVVYDIKEPNLRIAWNPVAGPGVEEARKNGQKVYIGGGTVRVPECLVEPFEKAHKQLITADRLVRRGDGLPRVMAGAKKPEMPAKVEGPALSSCPVTLAPAAEAPLPTPAGEPPSGDMPKGLGK